MATKKKMLQAAAGNAGGAGLDITEVFSTYLLQSTTIGVSETVSNGVDLLNEGGLVWSKARNGSGSHILVDTERGASNCIFSDTTGAQVNVNTITTAFYSDGFESGSWINSGGTATDYASWTFRKAPKFFDVVTYTGTGSNQNISHNLGVRPGFVVVKKTSGTGNWSAWHGSLPDANDYLLLNTTNGALDGGSSYNRNVTDTTYQIFGDYPDEGSSGQTYVAYLFAHNDGDGGFGPDGDQDIIKCGSYTGNGSTNGPEIDLGFEPQFVMVKKATAVQGTTQDWFLFDSMRGWLSGSSSVYGNLALRPNSSGAEWDRNDSPYITSTGFQLNDAADRTNGNGDTYIYMAIRRGPLAPPESATEVFNIDTANGTSPSPPHFNSGFPVDFEFNRDVASSADWYAGSRLTGSQFLRTNTTDAQQSDNSLLFDYQNGFYNASYTFNTAYSWMWKRAPGFFDAVAYTGDGTGSRVISHNLGVEPELIINKRRSGVRSWFTQAPGPLGYASLLYLDLADAASSIGVQYGMSTASADTFTTGTSHSFVNSSGDDFITYLFATLPGVSKVGSFTKSATSIDIDCGFTTGARFILFKKTSSTGDWWVHDTARGINASAIDPYLKINTADAEGTNLSLVEPLASGFTITSALSTGDYIFYAIA